MRPIIEKNLKSKASVRNKKRIIWVFVLLSLVFLALMGRLAQHQIINYEKLSTEALAQQTKDSTIEPSRGIIYDRNGNELASTSICYTLYVRVSAMDSKLTNTEMKELAGKIAEIVDGDRDTILEKLEAESGYLTLAKYLDKDQYKAIKELKVSALELVQGVKRYYPLGTLASQLLGSVTDDNTGRSGLELEYDQYLSGVAGRWIKSTDLNGNELVDGATEFFAAQPGLNVVTTIDQGIQYYVEKAIEEGLKKTGAEKIECIVMDPKTAEILASACTGGFDPNNPLEPADEKEKEKFKTLSEQEQVNYLVKMWRNPLVSDTYEPGSTFKLVTSSAALEERAITMNDTFRCGKHIVVSGIRLNCWSTRDHGVQTIKQAVGNSCNPVMVQVSKILGKTKFHKYVELYGMTEKTGIDYPGEADPITYTLDQIGPVELATMSYGHGIAITPIQLLTGACVIGNNGVLMKPHYVKALTDSEGNIVQEFEPEAVRQVISEETANNMKNIMRYVVEEGGGGAAKVTGYDIGGKTGTANKIQAGSGVYYENNYCSSFLGMAPMEDPKIAVLVMVDTPKSSIYGSTVAAPIAKEIFTNVLRYINVEPEYTDAELKQMQSKYTTVPNITGYEVSEAIGILAGKDLTFNQAESSKDSDDWIVKEQYPKAGTKVEKNSAVYLYKE